MAKSGKRNLKKSILGVNNIYDTDIDINRRIVITLSVSSAIANTIGFLANFFLYGMTFPTAVCACCAFLFILNILFGIKSKYYLILGVIMLVILIGFEFPLLVFTYGPVMYPYMIIGYVGVVMLAKNKLRTYLCTLICIYDVAVIVLSSIYPYIFGEQESAGLMGSAVITFVVTVVALTVSVIIWQTVYIHETSDTDSVTGVLSNTGFLTKAEHLLENEPNTKFAILFFNIKGFKAVNAVYGIDGGNRVLIQLSERLKKSSSLKPRLVSRFTGDRFVCMVEAANIENSDLGEICKFRYIGKNKSLSLQLNCGIYIINDISIDIQSACDRAKAATRYSKNLRNDHFAYYDDEMEKDFHRETELLGEVEEAIEQKVFEPFYQPIVDSQTQKIVSAEALARWISPEKGMISPGVFIPVLEQKELISDLDKIIAEKVNLFLESRAEAGKPIVPISVNLSRVDLYDSNMMSNLQIMVRSSKAETPHYRFEVTESAYESLPENVISVLSEFRKLGAKILVDDFGSGYSSLGMITDYEFDIIKLDMKFAAKIGSNDKIRGVICSLIELSHNLNAKVVAEGVETKEQYEFLRDNGCDYIQGYYFYKPVNQQAFIELLDNQK